MYIISVLLENRQSGIALYDQNYKLVAQKTGSFAEAASLCKDVISETGITLADVAYIGIASDCADLTALKSLGIPCYEATLLQAKALGEAYLANDVPYLFMMKADDTVESDFVIDQKIYSNTHPLGGSIAHTVIQFGGYECACGKKGCFEAYVSLAGLRRIAADAGVANAEALTHKALFAMSTPEAESAKALYVNYLASGLTNIINLFQPNAIILDGPFTEVGDALMAPMMDIILREQYSRDLSNKCDVRLANREANTAQIGAALLGR